MSLINYLNNSIKSHDGKRIKLPDWCTKVKIDIGTSHNAPNSQQWLGDDNNLIVFAFEPNQNSVKTIKGEINPPPPYDINKRFKTDLLDKRFFIFPVALSDYRGESDFYEVKNNLTPNFGGYDLGSSSLNQPTKFEYDVTKVQVHRLEEFFNLIEFTSINYIEHVKIDAQGEDFKIIEGIGTWLKSILYLSFETTTYNQYVTNKNTYDQFVKIKNYLNSFGFSELSRSNTDATFINNNLSKHLSNHTYYTTGT